MDRKLTTAPESSCTSDRDGVSEERNGVRSSRPGTDGLVQNIQVRMFLLLASFQTFKMFLLMIIVSDFARLLPRTGALEAFHSALLIQLPERQALFYVGKRQRARLSVFEHKENIVTRKQAKTAVL